MFRTKMGEISVHATEVDAAFQEPAAAAGKVPRPEATRARYRQRYVDLIVNPEVRSTFEVRSKFIKFMRKYLDEQRLYGSGDARAEHHLRRRHGASVHHPPQHAEHGYVYAHRHRAAPQAADRRRLDRVYEIGRIFRNEGMDPKHNPEFTTVELYQAYADFHT